MSRDEKTNRPGMAGMNGDEEGVAVQAPSACFDPVHPAYPVRKTGDRKKYLPPHPVSGPLSARFYPRSSPSIPGHAPFAFLLFLFLSSPLSSAPVWTAPKELAFGALGTLELREDDPSKPAPPRPGDDRLGPLELRGAEPLADGRGWRLTVQALQPGTQVVPPVDLGDGRSTPGLRISVPRTTPFGAPWVGVGGGQEDVLPLVAFPWAWASLLLFPVLVLIWVGFHFWRRGSSKRSLKRAQHTFRRHWPPPSWERPVLDQAHARGRDLLAARFGEEARSWGTVECSHRHLGPWVRWVQAMDEGRFGGHQSQLPTLEELLRCLEAK